MRCKYCKEKIETDQPIKFIPLSAIHEACVDGFVDDHFKKKKVKKKTGVKNPKKLTQDVFNRFIRMRDTQPEGVGYCISCGATLKLGTKNCQAGHYKSVGSRNDLRFNEDNCHVQCLKCNKYGERDVWIVYQENLIKKIGQEKVDALEERSAQDHSEKNLDVIRKKYLKKCRDLEQT